MFQRLTSRAIGPSAPCLVAPGLLASLALLLAGVGCASGPSERTRFYELGQRGELELEEGRSEDALAAFRAQSAMAPDAPGPYYSAARALALSGDVEGALESLERAAGHGFQRYEAFEEDESFAALHEHPRHEALVARMKENRERFLALQRDPHRELPFDAAPLFESLEDLERHYATRERELGSEGWRQVWTEGLRRRWALYDEKLAALRRYVAEDPESAEAEKARLQIVETLFNYRGPSWIGARWGALAEVAGTEAERGLAAHPQGESLGRLEYLAALAAWYARPEIEEPELAKGSEGEEAHVAEAGQGDAAEEKPAPRLYRDEELAALDEAMAGIAERYAGTADGGRALVRRIQLAGLRSEEGLDDAQRSLYAELDESYGEDEQVSAFARRWINDVIIGIEGVEAFEGVDLAGKTWNAEAFRGQVVLIDFWATWCGPCVAEMPKLKEAYERYHEQGFEIIGVSLDHERKALDDYLAEEGIAWPQIYDGKGWEAELARKFGVSGIPLTVLLDRGAEVAAVDLRGDELSEKIGELLAEEDL